MIRNLKANDLLGVMEEIFNSPIRYTNSPVGDVRVDIKETNTNYVLLADLPGVAKENVKIKFEKGNLVLSVAEVPLAETKEGEKILRNERFSVFKTRSFYFGDNVNDAEIKASFKDGVLTLDVPKYQPTVSVREINIE